MAPPQVGSLPLVSVPITLDPWASTRTTHVTGTDCNPPTSLIIPPPPIRLRSSFLCSSFSSVIDCNCHCTMGQPFLIFVRYR
jgi:hypothetical protein